MHHECPTSRRTGANVQCLVAPDEHKLVNRGSEFCGSVEQRRILFNNSVHDIVEEEIFIKSCNWKHSEWYIDLVDTALKCDRS